MSTVTASFDSGHTDAVHDIQFDYYGKRVASCSSDRLIKVFEVAGEEVRHLADLPGHEGPVWQVAWAHPKYGSLLASCSFDHKVIVWKETPENSWSQIYTSPLHTSSVNSICFAPHELGLMLASASSDGSISILEHRPDGTWHTDRIENAHLVGANAVSWAPVAPPGALFTGQGPGQPVKRLVSCGNDKTVKVWVYRDGKRSWEQDGPALVGHDDWVRDVAWAPNQGLPSNTLASAGQDGKLIVWTETGADGGWDRHDVHDFQAPVWRVSWSVIGSILAVSDSKNNVTLWKESIDGQWQNITA